MHFMGVPLMMLDVLYMIMLTIKKLNTHLKLIRNWLATVEGFLKRYPKLSYYWDHTDKRYVT